MEDEIGESNDNAAEISAPEGVENAIEDKQKDTEETAESEQRGEDVSGEEFDEEELVDQEVESEESEYDEEAIKIKEEDDKFDFEEEWPESEGEGHEFDEEGGEYGELGEAVEEEGEVEEGPPDPAAPYNLTDSSEALKAPFELRPDQFAEVEALWALFQDYTPAYIDLDNYVTETELVYMLKSLNLMTYTPEQLMELIVFCVRPPHPDNHVNFEQFVHIVTIRQRDMPQEEEIRLALEVYDPDKTGLVDREYLREQLGETGHKMKNVDNFIKEVDMSNDGTLGIEDIVGTICIDLNRDDIDMLLKQIYPPEERNDNIDNLV